MELRIFGTDVEVQGGFWVTAFLLGMPVLTSGHSKFAIAVWVAVVFVSILAHEFGHAFAARANGLDPAIALHWMGGTTTFRAHARLSRFRLAFISIAGPLAGFGLAALMYAAIRFAPALVGRMPELGHFALEQLFIVNIYWGLINLVPVLPFDGGHVLEHLMGPKRVRATSLISLGAGIVVALWFLSSYSLWGAFIFGMGAIRSYQRFRSLGSDPVRPLVPRVAAEEPLPLDYAIPLERARKALEDDDPQTAIAIAAEVLVGTPTREPPPVRAMHGALEILAWAHLMGGQNEAATEALENARKIGPTDAALAGAVLLAHGAKKDARKILEAARADGDHRKEIVGPLVQILIEQDEVPRAAAVALDIVDSLSEDDARKMASIAYEHRAFDWSARLYESVFDRAKVADDAYDAARALAQDGQLDHAMTMLRRAVDAGFSDRARAWSDAALDALRGGADLEAVVPRP
jgi:Zn-dependent protease